MIIWGIYLSLFWAISIYSIVQDRNNKGRFLNTVENLITSLVITFSVLGLLYQPIGETFAPFLIVLLPLSAYYEIGNALEDLKSGRIKEQLDEDIPDDILNNIAFVSLSAILAPGYIASLVLIFKYGVL